MSSIKPEVISDSLQKYPIFDHIQLAYGEITQIYVDCLVSPSGQKLQPTNSKILEIGGDRLKEAIEKIRSPEPGKPYATKGFSLKAFEVFSIITPTGLTKMELFKADNSPTLKRLKDSLFSCYYNCLEKAVDHNHVSIAFPTLGIEKSGWPVEVAVEIAVSAVRHFREKTNSKILVIFCTDELKTLVQFKSVLDLC